MHPPPQTPIVLAAAILASVMGFVAWTAQDTPGARPFALLMFGAALWALADGLVLASANVAAKAFWDRVSLTVTAAVPATWLVTVLAYTGRDRALAPRWLGVLAVEPAAFTVLVWTSGHHDLVFDSFEPVTAATGVAFTPQYGVAYWGHVAYSFLLVAVGAAYLVRLNFRTSQPFRAQGTALLLAAFLPVTGVALRAFGLLPPGYDLTSASLVAAGLIVGVAVFRRQLFAVSPATRELGRDVVIDGMDDQVVIVDGDDRVVDVNPAAASLFDVDPTAVVGDPLSSICPDLAEAVAALDTGATELELRGSRGVRYYDVRVSRLRRYGSDAGRVVSLRDVTGRRQREQRLDVFNRLLRHNVRNEMNVVRGNAELLGEHLTDPEASERLDSVTRTVDTVLTRSEKVGRLSRTLSAEEPSAVDLAAVLSDLAADARRDAPAATVRVDAPEGIRVVGGSAVRLALGELFENAIQHAGDAPTVEVTARRTGDGYAAIRVADDGPGIDDQERAAVEAGRETALRHGSGVGLWIVHWVAREFGGTVTFGDDADGCTVIVHLPLADEVPVDVRSVDVPAGDD